MSTSTPTSPSAAVAAAHPASIEKDDNVPPVVSPIPPSTSPSNNTALPPPVAKRELSSNPKIAELQSIFPTVDVSVIELVLFETCGGSSDRAIEQLLGMTDENFRPDELERTREDSQVDLDAEFARSLQMQDEEDLRRQHQQQQQQSQGGGGVSGGGLPYQPRVRRARPAPSEGDAFYQPQQQQGYQNRDTQGAGQGGENPPGMLALEDKLEKYAEVGKQTFTSLLSRAKAKYSEYQASQAQAQRTNTNYSTPTAQGQGGGGYGDRYAPGGSRGGEQGRGLWGDMNAHSPSVRSESISSESTLDPPYPQQPQSQAQPIRGSQRWQPTDTYDDPLPPPRGTGVTSPNRIDVVGRASPNASMGGRGSPGIGSPEKGKIDPAKLGILPKKKVDLFSTSPNQSTLNTEEEDPNPSLPNAHQSLVSKIPQTPPASSDNSYRLEDSDDELEYTKNPFDEK